MVRLEKEKNQPMSGYFLFIVRNSIDIYTIYKENTKV